MTALLHALLLRQVNDHN